MHLAFPENGQVCVRLGPLLPTRGGGFGPHAAGPFGLKVLSLSHMSLAIPGSVCTASRKLACSGGSVQPSCSDSITLAELQDPQRRAAQGRAGAVPGEEAARLGVEGTLNTNQNWVVGGGGPPCGRPLASTQKCPFEVRGRPELVVCRADVASLLLLRSGSPRLDSRAVTRYVFTEASHMRFSTPPALNPF